MLRCKRHIHLTHVIIIHVSYQQVHIRQFVAQLKCAIIEPDSLLSMRLLRRPVSGQGYGFIIILEISVRIHL